LLKEKQPSQSVNNDEDLKAKIKALCLEHPTHGYRLIKAWLKNKFNLIVNRKKVYRLMKEMNLSIKQPSKFATRIRHHGKIPVSKSNEHFQADMTKIWCGRDGWGYLFAFIDGYDKEIVGYHFSKTCNTDDILVALDLALNYRFPFGVRGQGLIVRTDNGCQMTSRRFIKSLLTCEITHQRTGYNNPDANAFIERWFKTLKQDEVWLKEYSDFNEAKTNIEAFIKFYNEERPHSAIKYMAPKAFYETFAQKVA
jgi:putative transposase